VKERLLLDTDVLIDYLRGVRVAVEYIESRNGTLTVSSITVAELFAGVRDGDERSALTAFLSAFEVIPVDRAIAERGGLLRRDHGGRHGTGLADALIAATAEQAGAWLVSLNRKHFPMVDALVVPYRR